VLSEEYSLESFSGSQTNRYVKAIGEIKNGSKAGRLASWLAPFFQGVFLISAGTLIGGIGGMLLGLFGFVFARSYLFEEMLAGGAVGALWAVLKITRFKDALSFGIGMLVGSEVGIWFGGFYNAIWSAPLGGCVGMLLQRVFCGAQTLKDETKIPVSDRLFALFMAMAGVVVGGFSGALLSAWLCIIIVFQTLPWKMSGNMDQAGLLILPVGMLGGIVGAVFGGRLLYFRLLRPFRAGSDRNQTIIDYEEWKQQRPGCSKEGEPSENQEGSAAEAGAKGMTHG
jgi:hypothetical protein